MKFLSFTDVSNECRREDGKVESEDSGNKKKDTKGDWRSNSIVKQELDITVQKKLNDN